jgi:aspartyl aminopeptidase
MSSVRLLAIIGGLSGTTTTTPRLDARSCTHAGIFALIEFLD